MAENLMKLKRRAVSLGMDAKHARTASRKDLEAFVSEHSTTDAPVKKGKKKVASAPVKKRKKAAPAAEAPKKRGRPVGSKNKPKATPAKSTTAKASTKKAPAKAKASSNGNGDAGRLTISRLDYNVDHDGWNPRKGSPVERIWKSLKRNRDNVEKVYDELLPSVKEIVGSKKRNGEKRTKAELEAMLRYRINRTRFEFAVRTEQHDVATNRVEYGTGDYASKSTKGKKAKAKK